MAQCAAYHWPDRQGTVMVFCRGEKPSPGAERCTADSTEAIQLDCGDTVALCSADAAIVKANPGSYSYTPVAEEALGRLSE